MIKFELSIRDIQESDALEIYRWRNDPITVKHSKTGRWVELEEHTNWLKNLIAANKELVQIAVINERPIGIIFFTRTSIDNLFEISINISPEFRKQGLGKIFLTLSEVDLVKKVGKCTIRALILANNKDSISFFVKCKYEMIQKNKDSFVYEKNF